MVFPLPLFPSMRCVCALLLYACQTFSIQSRPNFVKRGMDADEVKLARALNKFKCICVPCSSAYSSLLHDCRAKILERKNELDCRKLCTLKSIWRSANTLSTKNRWNLTVQIQRRITYRQTCALHSQRERASVRVEEIEKMRTNGTQSATHCHPLTE